MISENIKEPKDYLCYSKEVLVSLGVMTDFPKIFHFYQELCNEFEYIYYDRSKNLFDQLKALLAIDAQIQILLELFENSRTNLCKEFCMDEHEIICMIKNDKKSYYRELTGQKNNQVPKWSLIYLSEE